MNLVRGPARKPGWAQLIRLGGDRVSLLFSELRNLIGRTDGVVERLRYSGKEKRWGVHYLVGDTELFTVRISPGLLEAGMALSRSDVERLFRNRSLGGTVRDAIRVGATEPGQDFIWFTLKDRRMVRALVNLARAKHGLVSNGHRGNT